MTIVEYFHPLFKARGFRKKGKTFVKDIGISTQFATFQRMTSFDDNYLTLGVAYKDLPSNFVITSSQGCPVEVDVQVLAMSRGFKFSLSHFNSNIDQAKIDSISEIILPLIDEWFSFWSNLEMVRKTEGHDLRTRGGPVQIWPKARSFLEIEEPRHPN